MLGVSLCSPASSPPRSGPAVRRRRQGYKHVPQRPAYIGERTRGIGVVQRPVREVAVCYHYKGRPSANRRTAGKRVCSPGREARIIRQAISTMPASG